MVSQNLSLLKDRTKIENQFSHSKFRGYVKIATSIYTVGQMQYYHGSRARGNRTAGKYNLAYSVLSNLKRKYSSKCADGLGPSYEKIDPNFKRAQKKIRN